MLAHRRLETDRGPALGKNLTLPAEKESREVDVNRVDFFLALNILGVLITSLIVFLDEARRVLYKHLRDLVGAVLLKDLSIVEVIDELRSNAIHPGQLPLVELGVVSVDLAFPRLVDLRRGLLDCDVDVVVDLRALDVLDVQDKLSERVESLFR